MNEGGPTNASQELGFGESFCKVPGGRVRCRRAVEGMQSRCDGGKDRACIGAVSCATCCLDGCV